MTLDPFSASNLKVWERLTEATEAVVVISLVGAGLKIDSRHLLLAPPIRRPLLVSSARPARAAPLDRSRQPPYGRAVG